MVIFAKLNFPQVKRKCNVNIKNEHGQTPLHNAALRAGEGNVLFLLQNGSKVNETNKYELYLVII